MPSQALIEKKYVNKEYDMKKIFELQADFKFLNWTKLFQSLTGREIQDNASVQVYFKEYFRDTFTFLTTIDKR